MAKDRVQPVFDVASITGLSEASVAERLREEGYNELPSSRQRSVLAIALEVVREPMFLLAGRLRPAVHGHGRADRCPDAPGFRLRGHGNHDRPGAADRAGLGGTQGPFQPQGPGGSRRAAEANCRAARSSAATSCSWRKEIACRPTPFCSKASI